MHDTFKTSGQQSLKINKVGGFCFEGFPLPGWRTYVCPVALAAGPLASLGVQVGALLPPGLGQGQQQVHGAAPRVGVQVTQGGGA